MMTKAVRPLDGPACALPAPRPRPAVGPRLTTAQRAEIVAAMRAGLISPEDVAAEYGLSPEEIAAWERTFNSLAVGGSRRPRAA